MIAKVLTVLGLYFGKENKEKCIIIKNMAYGIKEQECRLDLSKKHTGKCYQHLPI